ncbi:MAG: hypothetical protein E6Q67_04960 [Roseateles sp.]|nr:MAG: hypothetical protein E6Q67_04960 [Roseateles sp.]
MTPSPFFFSSARLPSLKAKQLQKAFPFLKLAAAQEATARALGFTSWYDCHQRGPAGQPSPSDQAAGLAVRVVRYCHQAGVLVALGITPSEADDWVRAWGLTGTPTLESRLGVPLYYRWNDALLRLQRGELSEEELLIEWGSNGELDLPEFDRPTRMCEGVILGYAGGKLPFYALDPARHANVPIYLRGPQCLYHYYDDSDLLAMSFPDFPREHVHHKRFVPFPLINSLQHEWHYGSPQEPSSGSLSLQLTELALSFPDEIVILSIRRERTLDGDFSSGLYAFACLRGRDFAAFVQAKGVVDSSKILWYRNVRMELSQMPLNHGFADWLDGQSRDSLWGPDLRLPIFLDAARYTPSLPLYSYPFATAPLSSFEYQVGSERICLLPLDQDWESDADVSFGSSDTAAEPDAMFTGLPGAA